MQGTGEAFQGGMAKTLPKLTKRYYDSKENFPAGEFQMNKLIPTLVLVLILACVSLAQQPTPTPPDSDDVVKISTSLIQIDVTATDKKGKIVRDLKPEEFEVYENGKKQSISNFTFISNTHEVETPAATPASGQVLPPTPIRPERVRRTIALVVDDLSLSFESTYYARRALKKFVDEQMQDGDLVAIIRTGAGIGALQQFTTDKRQLYAAIERLRWNPAGTGNIGAFAPLEAKLPTDDAAEPEPGERTTEDTQKEFDSFRESVFATGTLGAVNYVVRGMQELPGRKSIMLISDGFKLYEEDADGFRESGRVMNALRRLVDAANRASVVIYTLDARGLAITGLTAADDTGGRSPEEVAQEMSDRSTRLLDTQDGLKFLAAETGGYAIVNSNDLSGGIRRILDDQSYYLIGYQPDDETFDPRTRRFNRLEIKVRRPGVKVRYRSGFFGVSDEKLEAATQPTGQQRLVNALTSPFAVNQVAVRLNTLFGNTPANGSYLRSLLHVRTQDLKFEDQSDGSKSATFDILAVAFGDNGAPAEQLGKSYTLKLRKDVYERFAKNGFVYDFTFPMKKPGAYQLRVALYDHGSNKVGSANQFIEVPNLKKDRLTLSGVVLEDVPLEEWKRRSEGKPVSGESNPMIDTSLRQFKRGTILNYGLSAFNTKPGSASGGNLQFSVRLFRDGQTIFEGKPQTVPATEAAAKSATMSGSLVLGNVMTPGDYVMQITVTDKLAKPKYQSSSQFVQFEVVE
jgi:VWFA-related protein